MPTDYGSDDFKRRYAEAEAELSGHRKRGVGANRTVPGSLSDLVASYYKSPVWRDLGESTKRTYRGPIEKIRSKHGDKRIAALERKHVMAILAEKADTPSAANNLRKRLAQLLDHAIALDWIKANPARLVKPYRIEGGGFHPWDDGEISRFFEVHEPGTLAHRAVTLVLYTGAARVDAVKLGPWNIKGNRLEYRRQKSIRNKGVLVSIPIHPDLAEVLDNLPDDRPFLATAYGKARSPDGLGNKMREWCDKAGLMICSAHGLRKACARRLAEAGASAHEIMAVTGHKTLAEVQRYTESAMREGLADEVFAKLISRPNREQTVVNLPHRFTTKHIEAIENK
ncbi:MAG TPA: tyrosine-type recombinase/integrase [Paracoccus sp.]|nr:tyrosine-type recombinase/integrase [Paracoccus sp. (in: a-proteobacteria)]